jgi:hypothetical protein
MISQASSVKSGVLSVLDKIAPGQIKKARNTAKIPALLAVGYF